jgi:hypothetical protein
VTGLLRDQLGAGPSWTVDLGDHDNGAATRASGGDGGRAATGSRKVRGGASMSNSSSAAAPTAQWPKGSVGSLATPGDRDMMARGWAFFDERLPTLGAGGRPQRASYAQLETDHWRVVMLDTGYSSWSASLFGGRQTNATAQMPQVIAWLRDVVELGDARDRRGIVLLSHHGPLSAFARAFEQSAQQLADIVPKGRHVVWLWGHERRVAMYTSAMVQGLQVHGRAIGSGGEAAGLWREHDTAPAQAREDDASFDAQTRRGRAHLLAYDNRLNLGKHTAPVPQDPSHETDWVALAGHAAFAVLRLPPTGELLIDYRCLRAADAADVWSNSTLLASERWTVNSHGGARLEHFAVFDRDLTVPQITAVAWR